MYVVVYSIMISFFPPPFSRLLMFFNIIRYDCSVFACIIVDFLLIDLPLAFNQTYIDQIRENITLSIINYERPMKLLRLTLIGMNILWNMH